MQQRTQTAPEPVLQAAALLGLTADQIDDRAAIRTAWRQAARRTHPDAGGSAVEFAAASDAYRTLCAPRPAAVATRPTSPAPAAAPNPADYARQRWVLQVQMRWPVAVVSTVAAGLLVVVVVLAGATAAAPLVVYLTGWGAYGWWHAAGRPRHWPLHRQDR